MATIPIINEGGPPGSNVHAFRSNSAGSVALFLNVESIAGCQLTPAEARRIANRLYELAALVDQYPSLPTKEHAQ
jgi:hypothetical protein